MKYQGTKYTRKKKRGKKRWIMDEKKTITKIQKRGKIKTCNKIQCISNNHEDLHNLGYYEKRYSHTKKPIKPPYHLRASIQYNEYNAYGIYKAWNTQRSHGDEIKGDGDKAWCGVLRNNNRQQRVMMNDGE